MSGDDTVGEVARHRQVWRALASGGSAAESDKLKLNHPLPIEAPIR